MPAPKGWLFPKNVSPSPHTSPPPPQRNPSTDEKAHSNGQGQEMALRMRDGPVLIWFPADRQTGDLAGMSACGGHETYLMSWNAKYFSKHKNNAQHGLQN